MQAPSNRANIVIGAVVRRKTDTTNSPTTGIVEEVGILNSKVQWKGQDGNYSLFHPHGTLTVVGEKCFLFLFKNALLHHLFLSFLIFIFSLSFALINFLSYIGHRG